MATAEGSTVAEEARPEPVAATGGGAAEGVEQSDPEAAEAFEDAEAEV
jgi:hypothetical protein